jgi:TetR/AcrR family transcriptional repressor of nem operon
VKVSGRKVAANRAALVETARRLLQERGFEGAGVVDISREAGLTQGALYGQFKSKNALTREAACKAFSEGLSNWRATYGVKPDPLAAYLDAYLSEAHLTDAGSGCLMAACVSDVARQDPSIGAAFATGFDELVALVADVMPEGTPQDAARRRAITLVSALVGSVAMARALEKADPHLSREILAAAREELGRLAAGGD